MPKAHRAHLEWSPSRLIDWARTIGSPTAALVEAILADRPHPTLADSICDHAKKSITAKGGQARASAGRGAL